MPNPDPKPERLYFETLKGQRIPSVTESEMREVDRIAETVFSLNVLQMMENAGRSLALLALEMIAGTGGIVILVGPGGNGGGGLSCARHLHNHGYQVEILLSHPPDRLSPPASVQYQILQRSGLVPRAPASLPDLLPKTSLIIDALLGYSLSGAPRGLIKTFIQASSDASIPILSLDIPSGMDASTGDTPGVSISPHQTLTLALPKRGLHSVPGRLLLGDIGIPPELYDHIGLIVEPIFSGKHWLELRLPAEKQ